ncbi:hypothetical protein HII17_01980 [Thalassotalea sp. M1531]|uniref:Uncharacterized protein n=1 Tax=Thalassotalea algicola TaxID=2716224 RepID=A0A7Y0Q612_9GAMM|nr:hypothetical protein [Thalassotalea algicola]NMP30317.1 hypothetical protein [Thalassotalea algicola]
MNLSLHSNSTKFNQYGLILLAIWLFALVSHTAHSEIISQPEIELECHLCYNVLDNLDDVEVVAPYCQHVSRVKVLAETLVANQFVSFIRPLLRAPPF